MTGKKSEWTRRPGAWIAVACSAATVALCAGVYGTTSHAPAPPKTPPGFFAHFAELHLVDHDARAFRLSGLQGKVVLLNFVFTGCAATCPTQTRELAALQQALPASLRRDVRFVSVSVDPLGDTPALLRAYGQSAGADFSS